MLQLLCLQNKNFMKIIKMIQKIYFQTIETQMLK